MNYEGSQKLRVGPQHPKFKGVVGTIKTPPLLFWTYCKINLLCHIVKAYIGVHQKVGPALPPTFNCDVIDPKSFPFPCCNNTKFCPKFDPLRPLPSEEGDQNQKVSSVSQMLSTKNIHTNSSVQEFLTLNRLHSPRLVRIVEGFRCRA